VKSLPYVAIAHMGCQTWITVALLMNCLNPQLTLSLDTTGLHPTGLHTAGRK
jgi:hypothetical protein